MGVRIVTANGVLDGVQADHHLSFKGIPYAEPPVGARLFAAPEPAPPWSGTRDASRFGPSAHQNPSLLAGLDVANQGNDCLSLNVYTPGCDGRRRTVMVWIHGGRFTAGSASQPLYDGGRLATRGDLVLVTINYRLGMFGYLQLDGAAANRGQLDQIAALTWVRNTIADFGGDPERVTVFGESAGAMSVTTLMAMPAANGLFVRAIAQSGATDRTLDSTTAQRVTRTFLEELGTPHAGAPDLVDTPVADLLAAQLRTEARLTRDGVWMPFAPVVEPTTLPTHPLDALRAGASRHIPLLLGTTRDEIKFFRLPMASLRDIDESRVVRRLKYLLRDLDITPSRAQSFVDLYRSARNGTAPTEPRDILDAIESDARFRIPSIRVAETHSANQPATFAYLFCWPSPALRGALGSCHALDLPFVFGTTDAPTMTRFAGTGPDVERLSAAMMEAWIGFAKRGDPNHPGLPTWPSYETDRRATMILDRFCEVRERPLDTERSAWDGLI